MDMEMMDEEEQAEHEVDCAIETLMEAEEIKADPELMAKVLERTKEKKALLNSVSKLRAKASKVLAGHSESDAKSESDDSEYESDPDLRTDDDKAALQEARKVDGKLKEMGFKKDSK